MIGVHAVDALGCRGKPDAVISIEAPLGADQDEPDPVLYDRRHRKVAEPLLVRIGLEADLLRMGRRAGKCGRQPETALRM